jgi:hypothetical protein
VVKGGGGPLWDAGGCSLYFATKLISLGEAGKALERFDIQTQQGLLD